MSTFNISFGVVGCSVPDSGEGVVIGHVREGVHGIDAVRAQEPLAPFCRPGFRFLGLVLQLDRTANGNAALVDHGVEVVGIDCERPVGRGFG